MAFPVSFFLFLAFRLFYHHHHDHFFVFVFAGWLRQSFRHYQSYLLSFSQSLIISLPFPDSYILREVAAYLNKPIEQTSLVVMHLGSGASVCAIKDGKSIDTSMGLTPLDGLPGATRSGHVDPSLIFHYTSDAARLSRRATEPVEITEAEEILNREAGWKALAGTTNFAQISERAGNEEYPKETLAFLMFVDRILGYVGSYLLKLGGAPRVDALVFSGGIGERSAKLRAAVLERCECVGFALDKSKNDAVDKTEGVVVEIGCGVEGMKSLVCRTDEQLEMARQCSLQGQFHE